MGLDAAIDALEVRARALLADEESAERKALRAALTELQDRQWLSGVKSDVLAEIGRAKKIDTLNTALIDAKPNSITAKNTELSKALITERLRGRFAQEVNHLDLGGLAIKLEQELGSKYRIVAFSTFVLGDIPTVIW